MQPAYWPWLGYFHRIAISDIFIVLDHVQIDKNSKTKFANRNKIRTKDDWIWLTVPLKTKGKFGELYLNKLEIANDTKWRQKHLAAISYNYSKAPFFKDHEAYIKELYGNQWHFIVDLSYETINYLMKNFNIDVPVLFSSKMKYIAKKDELLLKLCKEVGADTYISGPFGRDYIREQLFNNAGIKIVYHDYKHPVYKQAYDGFVPYMSALDLLLNYGKKSKDILMGE